VEGEALVWKPASQHSLWDSTRLPDQLDSRGDLDDPFPNPPAPQNPAQAPQSPSTPAEPESQADASLPIAALKAAASANAGSADAPKQPSAVPAEQSAGVSSDAGGAISIPYDWAVSIGPDGSSSVDGGPGSLTISNSAEEEGPQPAGARGPGGSGATLIQGPPSSSKGGSRSSNGILLAPCLVGSVHGPHEFIVVVQTRDCFLDTQRHQS
jgi:hypothetical protein